MRVEAEGVARAPLLCIKVSAAGGVALERLGAIFQHFRILEKPGAIRILRQGSGKPLGATGLLPRVVRLP